jgi:hypothetical protein
MGFAMLGRQHACATLLPALAAAAGAWATGMPPFHGAKAPAGSTGALVCQDAEPMRCVRKA